VADAIEHCGGLAILDQLQILSNNKISKIAGRMIEEYFSNKEDMEMGVDMEMNI